MTSDEKWSIPAIKYWPEGDHIIEVLRFRIYKYMYVEWNLSTACGHLGDRVKCPV